MRKAHDFDWWGLVPIIAFVAAVLFFTWAARCALAATPDGDCYATDMGGAMRVSCRLLTLPPVLTSAATSTILTETRTTTITVTVVTTATATATVTATYTDTSTVEAPTGTDTATQTSIFAPLTQTEWRTE